VIRNLRILKDVLWTFALLGLLAAVFRMWYGLGATTNLTDAAPWGLWKVFNMVAGVALSTSGFTVGLLVYVLGRKRFRPLVRSAILIAFLGYGCSCTALLFDIGLPMRFWHPVLMWNHHSFLFEVFWCVLLYFTVATMELLPTILERTRAERVGHWLHRITFGLVIVGVSLSSLHHSSLGSLFLVTPQRLHPLWYSAALPVFFILSAMGAGLMVVVLLRIIYAWYYDPEPVFGPPVVGASCPVPTSDAVKAVRPVQGRDLPMLRQLAVIAAAVLGVYFVLKVGDLLVSGDSSALMAGTWESWLFGVELLITAPLPILLLVLPRTRNTPLGVGMAACSASAGLVLNRLNVGIFGYFWDAETIYAPSLAEWALGIGVVAAAGLVFLAIVENCSVFDDMWKERRRNRGAFQPGFDSLSGVWNVALRQGLQRVTVIAVFVVPVGWVTMYPPLVDDEPANPVRPSSGVDLARTVLRIDGNQSGLFTEFPHEDHRQRLGGDEGCVLCHHISLPGDHATPCSRCHQDLIQPTRIFDHFDHMGFVAVAEGLGGWHPKNRSCAVCHTRGRPKSAETATSCLECHEENIWIFAPPAATADLARAIGFVDAMHGQCLPCHEDEALARERPDLAECSNCHRSLLSKERAAQHVSISVPASSLPD